MNQAQKAAPKVQPDRIVNGVRMFNPSKPHGTIYADGETQAKFVQEHEGREVYYKADYSPIAEVVVTAKDTPESIDAEILRLQAKKAALAEPSTKLKK